MNIEKEIYSRAEEKCELCGNNNEMKLFTVLPKEGNHPDDCILVCSKCHDQLSNPEKVDPNHWRCLNDSMWSQVPAVQVVAWRMLSQLRNEGWPQDLLDMMYLDDQILTWAKEGQESEGEDKVVHLDCNGVQLAAGDTVILIKDLNVKGGGFTAKRGTAVRNISLVHDNPEQIEGKVNGQQIVILTQFVKKS